MLAFPLHRESSLVFAMKLIQNLLDEDGEAVLETDVFYWNTTGTDEEMPNFWLKEINLQMEWYNDDPGRGTSSSHDSSADLALFVLDKVKVSYGTYSGRKTTPC